MEPVPVAAPVESGAQLPPASVQPYYTISQVAALFGVSRVTVWRWIRAGRLPARRLGHRTVRIKAKDVEDLKMIDADAPQARDGEGLSPPATEVETAQSQHFVQFYESDGVLLDAVADFIGVSLKTGDAGIIVATPAHQEAIDDRLHAAGVEVDTARTEGRYVCLDAETTLARFMVDELPDPGRFRQVISDAVSAAIAPGRHLYIFGEMVALLMDAGNLVATHRLEALWNDLGREYPFSLMCGYSMEQFGGGAFAEVFDQVCAEHTRVIPAESYADQDATDAQLRAVAELQQKAASLEAEIAERRRVEALLVRALTSEQRKERELSDFVETAPLGLHWVKEDGTIQWANPTEMAMLGYGPDEYLGHHIAEFHADRDVIDDILARLGRRETLREYPARLRCKDGTIKHVLIDSSVLWEDDKFVHTRCFTRDITAQTQAESERQEAIKQREQFLSIAAHELKTPLTTVKGYAQLVTRQLSRGTAEPELLDACVYDLREGIQRLETLVTDLLDVSRLKQGGVELRCEQFDLSGLARHIVDRAMQAPERTDRHNLVFDATEPVVGWWDRNRLDQVLTNLLSNAMKYSPAGGDVRLTVRKSGDMAEVTVSDQGMGMDDALRARLFQPFVRGVDARQDIPGTGLGLYTTAQVVAQHGGSIEVDSTPGAGSRFLVRLPLSTPA